jgi:hypothetical protein
VGEALGRDLALRLSLDAVVADRGGGLETFLHVARLEDRARGRRDSPQTPA